MIISTFGCEKESTSPNAYEDLDFKSIVEGWVDVQYDRRIFVFRSDNTFTYHQDVASYSGTYSISGTKITIDTDTSFDYNGTLDY